MAVLPPEPNDFENNDEEEFWNKRAEVVAKMVGELEAVASSDLGLYAQNILPMQVIPGTADWVVQFVFQIGDRAYRKVKADDLQTSKIFQHLEEEMLADDLLRELREAGEEDGDEVQ